jgi:hypothetical protein
MGKGKPAPAQGNVKYGTTRIKCPCPQEFQDRMYGKGIRIANRMPLGGSRCTGCGREVSA